MRDREPEGITKFATFDCFLETQNSLQSHENWSEFALDPYDNIEAN